MYLSSLLISIFSFPALLSFALIARSLIRVSTRLAVDQTPPDYDKCHYWDKRYTEESEDGKSFDWLFSYSRLRSLLSHLIPEKSCKALVIGCGTAPFSTDMYIDGYFNIINADYSKVAIDFQEYRYPFMRWMVVDALNTKLEDASVPCVIDKSGPFDSIMCGDKCDSPLRDYVFEMHRILKFGGRFIIISMHSTEKVLPYFIGNDLGWKVSAYKMKFWDQPALNEFQDVCHSLIVCDKDLSNNATASFFPALVDIDDRLYRTGLLV